MKKIWCFLFLMSLFCPMKADSQSLAIKKSYSGGEMTYLGLPDYPPFSYYDAKGYHSVFTKPLFDFTLKRRIELALFTENHTQIRDLKKALFLTESCQNYLFIGAYSETKMFHKLHLFYPAVISNPIHIITLPDTNDKISSTADLQKLKGAAIKTEYFSDFVMRKINPLNLYYAKEPAEAYEKLFTGDIDYIVGGLYYNKMEASKLGIEQYLSYSKSPIFKIPVFLAACPKMPRLAAFEKALKEEMVKPEFAENIKASILSAVNRELEKNVGIVPPAFVKNVVAEPTEEELRAIKEKELKEKKQQEKELKEKKLEEEQKLDNILKGI